MKRFLLALALAAFAILPACAQIAPISEITIPRLIPPMDTPAYDPGGNVGERIAEIEFFRSQGLTKRITGECYSACTLWLGGPACVMPGVVFGFHGPHQNGRKPDPGLFDMGSLIIVGYYPARIRAAFWETWRHLPPTELHKVPASEFVAAGEIEACA